MTTPATIEVGGKIVLLGIVGYPLSFVDDGDGTCHDKFDSFAVGNVAYLYDRESNLLATGELRRGKYRERPSGDSSCTITYEFGAVPIVDWYVVRLEGFDGTWDVSDRESLLLRGGKFVYTRVPGE